MSRLKSALKLAKNGLAIFPLQPGLKVPLPGSRGFQDATDDPATIKAWWAANSDYNIGVYPYGGRRKFVIFDFEGPNKGHDLSKTIKRFTRKTGVELDPSDHLSVRTPSGGLHVYMEVPDDAVYTSTTKFVDGCDIRAHGGYVVGPGSYVHTETYAGDYTIEAKQTKPLPVELSRVLRRKQERVENNEADPSTLDRPASCKRAIEFLAGTEPAIEGQGGDDWTYKTACKVRNFGISYDKCIELMLAHWNDRCEPPWDADEIERPISHAYKYALEPQGIDSGDPNESFGGMEVDPSEGAAPPSERPARKWEALTLAQMANRPAPLWVIKKMMQEVGVGFLIGQYSRYKTYIAIDMACSIVTGNDFAGHAIKRQGAVLFLAGESPYGVQMRMAAWFKARKLPFPENLYIIEGMPNFGDPEQVKAFVEAVKHLGVVLVIVDTVAQASLGGDENSSKDMGAVLQSMNYIRDSLGCFVLGIHHMGKDESKGGRGWSGLPAAADMELRVAANPALKQAFVLLHKVRDAEGWPEKRTFQGSSVELGTDEDGEAITNLSFAYVPGVKAPTGPGDEAMKAHTRWNYVRSILATVMPPEVKQMDLAREMAEREIPSPKDHEETEDEKRTRASLVNTMNTWLKREGPKPSAKGWAWQNEIGHWYWRAHTSLRPTDAPAIDPDAELKPQAPDPDDELQPQEPDPDHLEW